MKKLYLLMVIIFLSGCNVMPGMQNPDISQMHKVTSPTDYTVPLLIPITPSLIHDQHISTYDYHIASADILNISIWEHPELSLQESHPNQNGGLLSQQGAPGQEGFLVNPHGYIYFPLIGNVYVVGKTVEQVRREMTVKLKKYIINPSLNVRIADFRGRKVYIIGEVKKPGFIPLNDQALSITDAIVLSGGLDSNAADPTHIYIIRGTIDRPYIYWLNAKTPEALLLAEHFYLKPNDILFISSAAATRWNRVLNQLLPTIQTVWYTKAIINN